MRLRCADWTRKGRFSRRDTPAVCCSPCLRFWSFVSCSRVCDLQEISEFSLLWAALDSLNSAEFVKPAERASKNAARTVGEVLGFHFLL